MTLDRPPAQTSVTFKKAPRAPARIATPTPPLASGCLPGVTRDLLLREIHVPGIKIGEKTLLPAEVEQADDVFITSTTRALLPVLEIEGRKVGVRGVAQKVLQAAFEKYVESYIAERRMTVSAAEPRA